MEINRLHIFVLLIVGLVAVDQSVACIAGRLLLSNDSDHLGRRGFPADFVFGTASSSYQYEGGADEGGRRASIWDTFTRKYPEKVKDRENGSFAIDSYHRYKEDVRIMKDIGFDAYRLSISWSHVLPRGTISGRVNQDGIAYYNNLINELLSNGIKPFVTLFHWDLPQDLEDAYGGFLNPQIIDDFRNYAELCFEEFGDRVKKWITMNEPLTFTSLGYGNGAFAPGRCSKWVSPSCSNGDSATEPYLVAHHQLLAHASAVQLYRTKYQVIQRGQIGITLNSPWIIPLTQSKEDNEAASRALAFMYNWFMEPLNFGSYPPEMVDLVGDRLPEFSVIESKIVKGSFDFIGLNYYTSNYAANAPCQTLNPSYFTDSCATITNEKSGIPIGPKAASDWLYVYPEGIQDLLLYTKNKFNNPVIYITENGVDEVNNGSISLDDDMRIDYYNRHLLYVQSAIKKGVDVRGYFAWSLMDNFEWGDGYTVRFGIVYIDYKDGLKRHPKKSAHWFQTFLH